MVQYGKNVFATLKLKSRQQNTTDRKKEIEREKKVNRWSINDSYNFSIRN